MRILNFILLLTCVSCATQSHQTLTVTNVSSHRTPYNGPKSSLVVGKFDNRSSYGKGIFLVGLRISLGHKQKLFLRLICNRQDVF